MKSCFSKCFKKRSGDIHSTQQSSIFTQTDSNRDSKILTGTLSTSSRYFLKSTLDSSPIFRLTTPELRQDLPKLFSLMNFNPSTEIIAQGKTSDYLFVINIGQADILLNGKKISECKAGIFLDELEFVFNKPRKYSIRAVSKCTFWALSRRHCLKIFEEVRKSQNDQAQSFLTNSVYFKFLPDLIKQNIFKVFLPALYEKGETILENGECGFFFIIFNGYVKLSNKNSSFFKVSQDEAFGGSLIFSNNKAGEKNEKFVSGTKTMVLIFDLEKLTQILGPFYREEFLSKTVYSTLLNDEYFFEISQSSLNNIMRTAKYVDFEIGKVVISNSKVLNTKVIILCSGEISSASNSFKAPQLLGYFKENYNTIGTGKYIALTNSIIAEISIQEIERMILTPLPKYINETRVINEIKNLPFFTNLQNSVLRPLIRYTQKSEYKKGTWLYKNKKNALTFYYICQGSVGIYENDDFVFRLDHGCLVGETCLLLKKRQNSACALTNISCYEFNKIEFDRFINEKIMECINKTLYYESSFNLEELYFNDPYLTIKSREYVVGSRNDNKVKYLVEIINKKRVYDISLFWMIVDQKCAVAQISHPHILRYLRTVADDHKVYFFYEYCEFITLDSIISMTLDRDAAKFIIISLVGILQYLHSKNILHRNICPGTIGIDSKGFVKIIGFKYIKECINRSYTMLDTSPIYKSKETITGAGYIKASEYWSLGVILFEMLTGKLPFGVSLNDGVMEIGEKVSKNSLIIPSSVSEDDAEIIAELMNESYKKRMQESILDHKWALPYKVKDILLEKTVPPFKPKNNTGRYFERNEKVLSRKVSLRDSLSKKNTENGEEFEWDQYF